MLPPEIPSRVNCTHREGKLFMRKYRQSLMFLAAGLLTVIAPAAASAASAGTAPAMTPAAAAAAVPTLTLNALGGPAAVPGDMLSSSLTPGTQLSLTTAPAGPQGLFCKQSVWNGQLLANPPVGGLAVIRVLPPATTIAACVDNNPTVIGVTGVVVNNLPDMLQVTGVGAFPIQLVPTAAPIQIVATLTTTGPPTVVCTYQAAGVLNGNTSLGLNPWMFVNQPFQLVGGPLPACGVNPQDFINVNYSPVIDLTKAGANVYVN